MSDKTTDKAVIASFVRDAFEAADEFDIEALETLDETTLAKAILAYRKKNARSARIEADLGTDEGVVWRDFLEQVQPVLKGEDFDALVAAFKWTHRVGVAAGEAWAPVVLPNGALLVRNHHRVTGFLQSPRAALAANLEDLHRELLELGKTSGYDGTTSEMTVVHRFDKEGGDAHLACVGLGLGDKLSACGQTVIFMSGEALSAARALTEEGFFSSNIEQLRAVVEDSRTGHVVLRTFKGLVLCYATYRADDALDPLMENFGTYLDTAESRADVIGSHRYLSAYLRSVLGEREFEVLPSNGLHTRQSVTELLIRQAVVHDYGQDVLFEMLHVPPVFHRDPAKPASYSEPPVDFAELLPSAYEFNPVYEFGYPGLPEDGYADALVDWLDSAGLLEEGGLVYLPREAGEPEPKALIPATNKSALLKRLQVLLKPLVKDYDPDEWDEDFGAYLRESSMSLAVVRAPLESMPEIGDLVDECKALSEGEGLPGDAVDSSVRTGLYLPLLGLYQSFDDGEPDSGNLELFVELIGD